MNKPHPQYFSVFALIFSTLLFTGVCFSQGTREILTNDKVIELVRLGLSENIIVEKIRQSECKCDTSTAAMGKLKAARVSDAVIMAMMESSRAYSESEIKPTRNRTEENDGRESTAATTPKELRQISEPGIYLLEDGKMTLIEPTVYSGSKAGFLGTVLTYGIKKSRIRAVVTGKSANMQINSRRPVFYFVFSREYGNAGAVMSGIGGYPATSPNEFILLSMTIKGNTREATLGEANAFSMSTGAKDKEIREFSFEKIQPGIYTVTPKSDLENGEFCFHYAGSTTGTKLFDFGVR
jgi:hypothetical protein